MLIMYDQLCSMVKKSSENPSTASLPDVSFNKDCDCKNSEVCGLCFRKKGFEMIDNELKLTGEVEVCDKCECEFSYKGEYRNICWECEHDYI